MAHKFLVHAKGDSVGVAVEPIEPNETVEGVVLEDGSTVQVTAKARIPLGHKIALASIAEGSTVRKYGESIGTAVLGIDEGQHVHTHNLKSARW